MSGYNPAFVGVENFHDLKISYRYQWAGLGADAPTFLNASFAMRVKQPIDLTYNSLRSSNTAAITSDKFPKSKTLIHGLGVNVFHESRDPTTVTGGGLNYSLHYAIARKMRLAIGIGAFYESQTTGAGIIYRDPNDPKDGMSQNQSMISARAGLLLYSKSFYFGVAYLPVWQTVINAPLDDTSVPSDMATAQLGVSLQLTSEFAFKPGVLLILKSNDEMLIEYTAKAFIQERFWFGFAYRDTEAAIISLGFDISNSLSFSYAYEMSTGDFKQFGDSSHDLVLAVRLNNFKRQKQYTW